MGFFDILAPAAQGIQQGVALDQQRQMMEQYKRALIQQREDSVQQRADAATAASSDRQEQSKNRLLNFVQGAVGQGNMTPSAGEAILRQAIPELSDFKGAMLQPTPFKQTAADKDTQYLAMILKALDVASINAGARTTAATTAAGSRVTAAGIRAGASGAAKPMNAAQLLNYSQKLTGSPPVDKMRKSSTGKVHTGPDGLDDATGLPMDQAQQNYLNRVHDKYQFLSDRQTKGVPVNASLMPTPDGNPIPQQPGRLSTAPNFSTPLQPQPLTLRTNAAPGAIPPIPTDYNDTSLLPDMENHASDFIRAFPTASISSRARSVARNKAVGGVDNSQHTHRAAFDAVGLLMSAAPQVQGWAAKRGLEVIPEAHPEDPGRAHFHIQKPRATTTSALPLDSQQAAAPEPYTEMDPGVASFYQKWGIQPGAANA